MTLMAPDFTFGEIGGFFYGLRRTGFRRTIVDKSGTPHCPPPSINSADDLSSEGPAMMQRAARMSA